MGEKRGTDRREERAPEQKRRTEQRYYGSCSTRLQEQRPSERTTSAPMTYVLQEESVKVSIKLPANGEPAAGSPAPVKGIVTPGGGGGQVGTASCAKTAPNKSSIAIAGSTQLRPSLCRTIARPALARQAQLRCRKVALLLGSVPLNSQRACFSADRSPGCGLPDRVPFSKVQFACRLAAKTKQYIENLNPVCCDDGSRSAGFA